jgi:hypothetical protein
MRSQDGSLWFTEDVGTDRNTTIRYYRYANGEWTFQTQQTFVAGVQQNASTFMIYPYIFTHGVNIDTHRLEECYLDVTNYNSKACNYVLTGPTALTLPVGSNYVGSAVSPSGYRIIWWVTTPQGSTPGTWSYLYNFGGGWNGPVTSTVGAVSPKGNANSFEYVTVDFQDDIHFTATGLAFTGNYTIDSQNQASYRAVVADVTLGQAVTFYGLGNLVGETSTSFAGTGIWVNPTNQDVHVISNSYNGPLKYFYKPGNHTWATHLTPVSVFEEGGWGELHFDSSAQLLRLLSTDNGGTMRLKVREIAKASITGAISWNALPIKTVSMPVTNVNDFANGVYIESRSKQTLPVQGFNFAICQTAPYDKQIWSYVKNAPAAVPTLRADSYASGYRDGRMVKAGFFTSARPEYLVDAVDLYGRSTGTHDFYASNANGTYRLVPNLMSMNGFYGGFRPIVADFNGDGREDILWDYEDTSNRSLGYRHLWTSTGSGGFSIAGNLMSADTYYRGYRPLVADFNTDGKTDILWDYEDVSQRALGNRILWTSTGNNNFSVTYNWYGYNAYYIGWRPWVLDFNGDRKPDIRWDYSATYGANWTNLGGGTFSIAFTNY